MMPCIVIPILMGAFIASQVKIVPQVETMMAGMEPKGLVKLSFQSKSCSSSNMATCCTDFGGNGDYHLEVDSG